MTRKSKRKQRRFVLRPEFQRQPEALSPQAFIAVLRQAENHVLPLIQEMQIEPGAALLILARWTQRYLNGHFPQSFESLVLIAERTLELWLTGHYIPDPAYPYTLQESAQALRNGPPPVPDYALWFRPFTPTAPSISCGLGEIACGLVKHPKTHLWQIWLNVNGPCAYLGAYRDATLAQQNLEVFIQTVRKCRFSCMEAIALAQQMHLQGHGEIQHIPYDMFTYLFGHLDRYVITL